MVFFAVAGANRHGHVEGISFPLYFMGAMAAYGAMFAAVQPGARIALDRVQGLDPPAAHHATSGPDLLRRQGPRRLPGRAGKPGRAVPGRGRPLGCTWRRDGGWNWRRCCWSGSLLWSPSASPLGHLVAPDSLTPAVGGLVVVFALLGGAYGPLFTNGTMLSVVKLLPSYWLVQASRVAVGGGGWPGEGWAVVAGWTAAMVLVAVLAYRRDTARV